MKNRFYFSLFILGYLLIAALSPESFMVCFFFLTLASFLELSNQLEGKGELSILWKPSLIVLLSFIAAIATARLTTYWLILLIVLTCSINDTFAYFFGSFWTKKLKKKGHPLAKALSPHKTIEGFIAGLVAGLVAFPLGLLVLKNSLNLSISLKADLFSSPTPFFSVLIFSLLINLLAVQGDLLFSSFKRQLQIKDYSHFLGGHGGVTDRIASWTLPNILVMFHLLFNKFNWEQSLIFNLTSAFGLVFVLLIFLWLKRQEQTIGQRKTIF